MMPNYRSVRSRAAGVAAVVVVLGVGSTLFVSTRGGSSDLLDRAVIDVLARSVERSGPSGFVEARSGDEAASGESVRTGTSGFAELTFADGSLSRLGPESEYLLTEVRAGEGERRIEGDLDVGETWHRVSDLSGTEENDEFVVATAVASASVRGTAFAVVCLVREVCTFSVQEGTVEVVTDDGEVITLTAGQTVTIAADQKPPPPEALSPDELLSDPWIGDNIDLDAEAEEERGEADDEGAAGPTGTEIVNALIEGDWSVEAVTTSSPGGVLDGDALDRRYSFEVTVCERAPCELVAVVETRDGTVELPVRYRRGAYRFESSFPLECDDVDDALTTTIEWEFVVTTADRDGATWIAETIAGTVTETQSELAPSSCEASTLLHEINGARR